MKRLFPRFLILVAVLTACNTATPEPTPTPTPDMRTPLAQTAQAQTQMAIDAQSTADAQATADALDAEATAAALATLDAENATATAQALQTATQQAIIAQRTARAATAAAGTEQAIVSATAQAQPMLDLVTNLQADGMLEGTAGYYTSLFDFKESWAQLNWFRFYPTMLSPSNFVIRADIDYASASDTADWWNSGCGFVFREQGDGNFYVVFLSLDGYGEISRWRAGSGSSLTRGYYGKLDLPAGHVKFLLVVENTFITVYINGDRVARVSDGTFSEGDLHYTLASGTNKGFGTSCDITNVELWTLTD